MRSQAEFLAATGARKARPFVREVVTADGDVFTDTTVESMSRLASKGSRDLPVRLLAQWLTEDLPGRDDLAICQRIFKVMQDRGGSSKLVKFCRDPWSVETVQAPWYSLLVMGGDCAAAHAVTCAALLMALGIPCFFRTVAVDEEHPHLFTHVYCVAIIRKPGSQPYELAMDTSVPFSQPGTQPKRWFRKKDRPIEVVLQDDWKDTTDNNILFSLAVAAAAFYLATKF